MLDADETVTPPKTFYESETEKSLIAIEKLQKDFEIMAAE